MTAAEQVELERQQAVQAEALVAQERQGAEQPAAQLRALEIDPE